MTSTIKVNNIQNQCGANIINESSNTITLGASGDTVTLASGASQSGFGRTGTVDWDTTAKTASFTAVSGNGYFINTTSSAITVTLPASPSAGDIVAVSDYAKTAATNNITIARNSSNIDGSALDLVLSTAGLAVTLVYVDATKGWKPVNSNEVTGGPKFITATGGTETTCGDYKIHTFTGPGNFTVSCAGNPGGSNTVDYLVVAGGGGGTSSDVGAGGGAGGYRESSGAASGCYSASPLGACVSALPVSVQSYPVTVGAGGASRPNDSGTVGNSGSNSIFSTITSTGGGGAGGGSGPAPSIGLSGGSGGGGNHAGSSAGGSGNTPPVSPPQGNNGGPSPGAGGPAYGSGGGGGAGAAGQAGSAPKGGDGGNGVSSSITGSSVARGGGGGGSHDCASGGANSSGGTGGGGGSQGSAGPGTSGTTNTGGGGGGSSGPGGNPPGPGGASGAGGSGIVVIRYKYQ